MGRNQRVHRRAGRNSKTVSPRFFSGLSVLIVSAGWLGIADALAQDASLVDPYQQFAAARKSGEFADAAVFGRQALALMEQQLGTDSIELVGVIENLAAVEQQLGAIDSAISYYQRSLAIKERVFGSDHPELVSTLDALASVYLQQDAFADAESVLNRILSIEQSVYGERHENVVITWNRLRELYQQSQRPDQVARVDAALEDIRFQTRDFLNPDNESIDGRRYSSAGGFATVRVFYGTNRARTGNDKATQFYGGDRAALETGYLDVSIPASHKYGELETESRWSIFTYTLGEKAKKNRYVLLLNVEPLDEQNFHEQLSAHIQDSPSKDVFVFVHGYNSTFSDAAMRAAQLAYDLDFDGTPMLYSWPSQGSTRAYTVDEAAIRVSGRKMAKFVTDVVDRSGADRIHLIAHSMGNRALIEALEYYVAQREPGETGKVFDQVVFTAPDVDRDYFVEVIETIKPVANRVTLYASENDIALKTSALIHGAPRAGLADASIRSLPGIDTIDMSAVKADSLGHTYFAANEGAIYDLFRLFWRGDSPDKRCGMSEDTEKEGKIWRFNVDVCRGGEVLEAGVLLKRFGRNARERVRRRLDSITGDKDEADKEEWRRILNRLEQLIDSEEPSGSQ